jgi:hypothetical protein
LVSVVRVRAGPLVRPDRRLWHLISDGREPRVLTVPSFWPGILRRASRVPGAGLRLVAAVV